MEPKRTGCLLVLVILAALIGCCVHGVRAQAAEPTAMGYQHLAGVDERLIWELPDKPKESELISLGVWKITYYCCEPYEHICGDGDGLTATGIPVAPGIVAVDPEVIPYGTTVVIDGEEYLAADCGGGIKGDRIDIAVPTHQEALELGVQYKEVWMIDEQ